VSNTTMREISQLISQYISEVSFKVRNTPMPKMNLIHDTIKEYMGWSPENHFTWDFPLSGAVTSCDQLVGTSGTNWLIDSNDMSTANLTFATTADTASTTIQGTRLRSDTGSALDLGI